MTPYQCPTRGASLLIALMLAGCAGQRVHSDAMRLMADGQHEAAISKLREANRLEPSNPEYRIDLLNATQTLGRDLIERAEAARRSGNAIEASNLYTRALQVDPANDRARRGLAGLERDQRSARLLAESERLMREGNLKAAQERLDSALAESPANVDAQRHATVLREHTDRAQQARAAQAAALSIMNKPVTLQFRDANLRMVFEALSRTTGLNVILDRDVRADLKTTIFVKDAAVVDTVDLILLQNQLEKRALNANTLFIYPATAAKLKEYQDLQVRTFQVANIDVKHMQAVLKTVLKIKDIAIDERSGTLVMRDTPDAIAVAAKVIAAHDVPESEVMLEVEVLEVSHDRLQNLGFEPPNSFSIATPDGAKTYGGLKALSRNELVVTPLGTTLNFRLEDSDSNLLASPRIRARNKEKARILIGDRVPIITNTVTPVQTGSSVVTGSVQYQDVGLKLEFEPQVYSELEVGIRISLEVSSIVKEIPGPNGSLAYQIGTRNAQTVLRLRDGETQILGGLISAEDRSASARLPGVGHLPMVGKLFGNNSSNDRKSEIVLSITPRIVRPPAMLDAAVRSVFAGTESSVRERALQLDPIGAALGQSSGGTIPAAPGSGTQPRASPVRPAQPTPGGRAVPQPPAGSQLPPGSMPQRGVISIGGGAPPTSAAPDAPPLSTTTEPVPTRAAEPKATP